MIYDCFTFYNELDILEIRLNILDDIVDKFILVEMNKTHTGEDKPFIFEENKERFSKFLDKIIHIKVENCPEFKSESEDFYGNQWFWEIYQRDQIMIGLKDAKDDDIVMISDVDEIPNPECIKKYDSGIKIFEQKNFYYFLNYLNVSDPILRWGTKVGHFSDLKDPKIYLPYNPRYASSHYGMPTYFRCCTDDKSIELIPDGGWHFSFVMDINKMILKRKSIVEQQYNTDENMSYDYIKRQVRNGKDLFGREYLYCAINIDKSFPEYILKNQKKYSHLISKVNLFASLKILLKLNYKKITRRIFSIRNLYKNGQKNKILEILFLKFHLKFPITRKSLSKYIDYVLNNQLDKSKYVEITERPFIREKGSPKLLSFYLPQFHSFPENDDWFGRGFTEWTNVTKAVPQYTGHYQPHLPIDVGFYNLETTLVMKRQIELAKLYGIYGFSFYYYWFSGKKIMAEPLQAFLKDKSLDLPFCIFWTNENWSRLWGGGEMNEVLYRQELHDDDYEKFMNDFLPYIKDERYIKIDGKPLLIILNPQLYELSLFRNFLNKIREIAKQNGFPDLYITTIRRTSMDKFNLQQVVDFYGMDAMIEFIPGDMSSDFPRISAKAPIMNPLYKGTIFDAEAYVNSKKYLFDTNCKLYKGLFPGWDNTPRKNYSGSIIFENTSPVLYKKWLKELITWSKAAHNEDDRFIFINAWNEWAEGAHLEPDQKYGYAYLQATKEALEEVSLTNEKNVE